MNALSVSFISSMGRCCLCGDLSRMNLPLGFLLEFLAFCRPLSVRLKSIPIGMGNTCKPMAVSFQCMTKFTTNKKKIKKKLKKNQFQFPGAPERRCYSMGAAPQLITLQVAPTLSYKKPLCLVLTVSSG